MYVEHACFLRSLSEMLARQVRFGAVSWRATHPTAGLGSKCVVPWLVPDNPNIFVVEISSYHVLNMGSRPGEAVRTRPGQIS
jgi:hypothetical protein